MCRNVATALREQCIGHYQKGNEPEPIVMKIMIAPCQCGEAWWAKVPDGQIWVEAEKNADQ